MRIRRRALPSGWYPADAEDAVKLFKGWEYGMEIIDRSSIAGIVPHAGWSFSGKTAYAVFSRIDPDVDTVVIIGGHLSVNGGILAAGEEQYETPFGNISADVGLLSALKKRLEIKDDNFTDNTVEVNLPIVHYMFPTAGALSMRAAPSMPAAELGGAIHDAAVSLGIKTAVIGSTDLTHYGPSYGLTSHGSGKAGYHWASGENDKRIIAAMLRLDIGESLELAVGSKAACSCGGAAAAMSFAGKSGIQHGELLEYANSYDVYHSDSFVGYAGIVYG